MHAAENRDPTDQVHAPGSLLTRVPGRARPQMEALREFEKGVAELRQQYEPTFWPLLIPEAKDMFR